MSDEYSLYDAKARLSALVRQVREGRTFIITVHGEPVAELRPIDRSQRRETLEERVAALTRQGEISAPLRQTGDRASFPVGRRVRGALKRFLDERD
jgi:prevent-host-death family protein